MIKGVLFDIGRTLFRPETGDWMLTRKFREYCPQEMQDAVDPEVWRRALMNASRPLAEAHNALKLMTQEAEEDAFTDFYAVLLNDAGIPADRETARIIAQDFTWEYGKYILYDGITDVLERLKAEGMRLGLLSDTWPNMPAVLDHAGISGYFAARTFSYEIGTFKPDRRIYEDALAKMGLPADEVVFIDDIAQNLSAAAECGIHGILACFGTDVPAGPVWPYVTEPGQIPSVIAEISVRSAQDAAQTD